jgi:hypothetical protein
MAATVTTLNAVHCRPRTPKKSVRLSSDTTSERDAAAHSAGPAAHAANGGRDGGGAPDLATPAGSKEQDHAVDGNDCSGFSAADPLKGSGGDAVEAKGHRMLPSWRAKMPIV